jgi:hypothetical protein
MREFAEPPSTAYPRVWWHWMNGNVTKAGIDSDFAWMKRVGIAGVQNFDGSLNTPRIVQTPLPFMSDGWRDAFKHAVSRADSLGLEFTIASSAGWSETGGPWVKPEDAMKKLVWSERIVEGGGPISGALPEPPSVAGPFQDIPAGRGGFGGGSSPAPVALYRDARVIAYRIPVAERDEPATITASSPIDAQLLHDGDRVKRVDLPYGADSVAFVQYSFQQPQIARAVTVVIPGGGRGGPGGSSAAQVQASDDGSVFRTIAEIPRGGAPEQTIAFPAVSTRHIRVLFRQQGAGPSSPGFGAGGGRGVAAAPVAQIAELSVTSAAMVNRFQDKGGWSTVSGTGAMVTPTVSNDAAIAKRDVVDLTSRMRSDGTLDWTPPPGRWRVLRFGWSLTGKLNSPASAEGTGLEVDKLNRDHVRAYIDTYLGTYEKAVGPELIGTRGVKYMLTDSYEAQAQNWTENLIPEFTRRRGYDPRPWLPVLAGRVVESADASDKFLWDFRRTLSDLIAENHYGELSRALHARGMGRYGESHETGRAFIGDGMEVKKSADVPMGATWVGRANPPNLTLPDIRESASVAHLYGQNLTAAESFTVGGSPTTAYALAPQQIKPTADRMMANGLNRFVIHTSVHQPLDEPGPGIGLGPFGEWFTRKEVWAEQAGGWVSYLARSSYLLQQGRFAADVAVFYGEDDNITALFNSRAPAGPAGYAWDFVNADAIRNLLTVRDGRLRSPSGASYRVLLLDPAATRRMTLPTLQKIANLVRGGGVLVGQKPTDTPSLADDLAEFRRLRDALWSANAGAGKVFSTFAEAATAQRLTADVEFGGDTTLAFVHRALSDGDVYFIANLSDVEKQAELSFRVSGRAPELWRADDASVSPLSYRANGGRTVVTLPMSAHDAAFVVFRPRTESPSRVIAAAITRTLATLSGPWTVNFPPERGAPASVVLSELASWTDNTDVGVKYFSGTATYSKTFDLEPDRGAGAVRFFLDLGTVQNVAEVLVNGGSAGIAWKAPYKVDVTDFVKSGSNRLEIRLSNLWPNRLIGDKQPGMSRKYATAVFDPLRADSPLLPSGLLGPVRVLQVMAAPTSR